MKRAMTKRLAGSKALVLFLLLAALMATSLLLTTKPAHAADFTVTNTKDSGAGSLRQAITNANNDPGADTIKFNISGTGVKTISPASELPAITGQVTIDGYTQPGASPNTLAQGTNARLMIELNGTNAGPSAHGLIIDGLDSVVKGLAINRFGSGGVLMVRRGSFSKVEGNFIGTDPSGTVDRGNGAAGVEILLASNSTVGGNSSAARNLISGNDDAGVAIVFGASSNRVEGNLIGTQKDGTTARGNAASGVLIDGGASSNSIVSNTIAFNDSDGVTVDDNFGVSTANSVLANSIFGNADLAIDLNNDGRTTNDSGDADEGPNALQNFPKVNSAVSSGASTIVKGTLVSTPSKTFKVQFFSTPFGGDASKFFARKFVGQANVTTSASGRVDFTVVLNQAVPAGQVMTATATAPDGSTSEISGPSFVKAA